MKRLKRIKKELKNFMKDESGKMSKENILRIGIGTIGITGMVSMWGGESGWSHTDTANEDHYYDLIRTYTTSQYDDYAPHDHVNHTSHTSGLGWQGYDHANTWYNFVTLERSGAHSSYDDYTPSTHHDHYDHYSYH